MSTTFTNKAHLIGKISAYARGEPSIRGLGLIGSWARKDQGPRSDLDMVVLLDEKTDISCFIDKFTENISSIIDVRETIRPAQNKILLFTGDDLIKLDLFAVHSLLDIEKYYKGSLVRNANDAILVDKDGTLLSVFSSWSNAPEKIDFVQVISVETEKFLDNYELASRYANQSDVYRFYFNYNIALSHYASLVQLEKGDSAYLYTPRQLLEQMDVARRNSMIKLAPSLLISEAHLKLEDLGNEFCSIYQRLFQRYSGLQRKTEDIRKFITAILDRDLISNFRDVSWVALEIIRPGQLYRSSTLAKFQKLKTFDEIIKKNGIQRIIDIRRPYEVAEYPYTATNEFEVISIPMSPRQGNSCLGGYTGHLHSDLLDCPEVIRKCFALLADGVPTLIHCHSGKDRTGVIVALVLLSAGVPEEAVRRDFLASGRNIMEKDAGLLLNRIKELGGACAILNKLGVSEETIKQVKQWVLVN